MDQSAALAVVAALSRAHGGLFRGASAAAHGVSCRQLSTLRASGVVVRELPDTFRLTAVARSGDTRLRALLWAGPDAVACGRSTGRCYGLEGVRAVIPEIVVARPANPRSNEVDVTRVESLLRLTPGLHRSIRVTGVEATLVRVAHLLDDEALEQRWRPDVGRHRVFRGASLAPSTSSPTTSRSSRVGGTAATGYWLFAALTADDKIAWPQQVS